MENHGLVIGCDKTFMKVRAAEQTDLGYCYYQGLCVHGTCLVHTKYTLCVHCLRSQTLYTLVKVSLMNCKTLHDSLLWLLQRPGLSQNIQNTQVANHRFC